MADHVDQSFHYQSGGIATVDKKYPVSSNRTHKVGDDENKQEVGYIK